MFFSFFSHKLVGAFLRLSAASDRVRLSSVCLNHDCFRILARLTAVLTRMKDFGWHQ
jgi:hypothetical protein